MALKKTNVAVIVGMALSQSAFGASMTVTGDIYTKTPSIVGTPKGTLYEGVKEAEVAISSDNDGCRVVFSPTATVPDGVVGCYVSVLDSDLPIGMHYDPSTGKLIGYTAQAGNKSAPYAVYYKSGKAGTPVKFATGNLPFKIEPTFPPIVTGMESSFDKPSWQVGKEQTIHKRQADGSIKVKIEKRPYNQKVVIDGFANCTVVEGSDNCIAARGTMQNVRGTDDVGAKVMAVDVNSSNDYFAPVIDQFALSWDFRPPMVADVVQGNLTAPLATIPTESGPQVVAFSNIAAIVNSPHNDAEDDWWNPATMKLMMAPDLNSPRKIYLSYKGKSLLNVASTTNDGSSVAISPAGNWKKTGTQQFRYDFDMNNVKDGDFLATLVVTDKYGNTSTTEQKSIRLDRYAPQVGLFGPNLLEANTNDVVFFPERMIVAAHNGYDGGIKSVTATFGGVDLDLHPTDTVGVFSIAKGDYSTLTPGNAYPFVVTATDQSDRVSTKTVMIKYASSDLSLTASPMNPVQFVQRTTVKATITGYDCPLAFDETQAMKIATTNNRIACFTEWTVPQGMQPSASVLGNLTVEGYVEQETGVIGYTLYAVSPEGGKMKVKEGSFDLKPKAALEPVVTLSSRRMQGTDGLMVDNTGGVAGSAIVSASPGDLEVEMNIPGLLEKKTTSLLRQRANGTTTKVSQIIKVPKGPIWTVYPLKVKARYTRTDKFNVVKDGNIYIVPNKRLKISLNGLNKESVDNSSTDITAKVGLYDDKSKQVVYRESDHGEWNMRLVQQVVTRDNKGAITKKLLPLTDTLKTDANGEAKLTFDPAKATGRAITYMVVGDVISPFSNFKLQLQSSKRHLILIKGQEIDGQTNTNEIVDRIPMKANIKLSLDTKQDEEALGQIEWQIRSGDSGEWGPAPGAKNVLGYTFNSEVPGKWQVRAILHNRMTGVTKPTDITTLVAYDKPEIKLVQKEVVLKGQPVKLELAGENGADISEVLNVQWSGDGKTWIDGDKEAEMLPAGDSKYIYARAEFAATEDEADESSWVTTKIMPRALSLQEIKAKVAGPSKAEVQQPFTLKSSFDNDYQLAKDTKFVEEWVLPDGSTTTGSTLTYTPQHDSEELTFIYRVWVDGYKTQTMTEVNKTVKTWEYHFPRFLTSQRQHFSMAPTTIEVLNNTKLPTNAPGVTFDFSVAPTPGVTEVSFDKAKGRYIAKIEEPGFYRLLVTLTDSRGNKETKEHVFAVDETIPMEASITPKYSNQFIRAPLSVTMSSGVTLDHPSDNLVEYGWVVDGKPVKDSLRRQLFSGFMAGEHKIEFNALSEYGQRAHVEHTFKVNPNTPPECSMTPVEALSGWRVKMNCLDADGKVVAYRWKINGEGIPNTSYSISMTKSAYSGPIEVEAVGVDDSGDEGTAKITLTGSK